MADKNGLTLALGSRIKQVYRNSLRGTRTRPSNDALEAMLLVPKELIDWLLSDEFERQFEQALVECND